MRRAVLAALLAASLTGCSQIADNQRSLAEARGCCARYDEVSFAPLAVGRPVRAAISTASPTFAFPEGKSYFVAYDLGDAGATTGALVVRTFSQNMLWNRNGHILVPRVTLLDAGKQRLSSVAPPLAERRGLFSGGGFEGAVPLPPAARYALVHTGGPGTGTGVRATDEDQYGGTLFIASGPTGEVEVLLQGR